MSGFQHQSAVHRVMVRDCPHDPQHEHKDRHECRKQRYAERKTIRHLVPSGEVAHLWAHKAQSEARNAKRSVFFRDFTIYSYGEHFPIARHVTSKSGKQAVLFTTAHYSVTTSGHCSMVASAIPPSVPVFHVPHVLRPWQRGIGASSEAEHHKANLKDYADRISEALLKAARARVNKEWDHKRALELREEAIKYAKFFHVPYAKVLPQVPALDSTKLAEIKRAEDKRQAAERKRVMEENREAIARWRNGENVRLPFNLPDMLRVSTIRVTYQTQTPELSEIVIETSRGASFPISHAKRGLALVRAVRERGEAWHTNGHTCQLGHYRIDEIQPDGTVKAGCHTVKWSEIERIAPQIDAAPSVLETLEQPQGE